MSFEETDSEDSRNSQSDVRSLDDDFARIQFESSSCEEEITNDDWDPQVWTDIYI